jgi:dipeptidyl aminopeptidase/acylaminoacyl peptidase
LVSATTSEERVGFPSRRGNRLVGIVHAATGATAAHGGVILCHGMESTKEGTKHKLLGERLSRRGFDVLRFDFSYVGESEGEFEDLSVRGEVEDLAGAWAFLRARVSGPIGILGSSMGGTVALLFAASEPTVAALATIAAVADLRRMLAELRPAEIDRWRTDGVFALAGIRLKKTFLEDVETLDVLAACRSVRCPAFVAHGDADLVVPLSDGEAIAAALGGEHRLKIYPGADHRFSKPSDLEEMLADTSEWLATHVARGEASR